MKKLIVLATIAVVGCIAAVALTTTVTACGGGCDASMPQECTADNSGLTVCLFGLAGEQDCVENFGADNVCCVVDGDATCAYPAGIACSFDSDCCSGTCDTTTNECT